MKQLLYQGKEILVSNHAVKQARKRNIAFPDQVSYVLQCGKVQQFGKNGIKFAHKGKRGSIICVGENIGSHIIIKTIERGN
jgi:hypothetical protein